jgi:uncharacterized protein YeaO (DUF488 family)
LFDIRVKRVYEPASPDDGTRVLVDRLWPRGLTAEKVAAALWLKEIAPSNELRQLFHHDVDRWDDFRAAYFTELDARPDAVAQLLELGRRGRLTLLFAARDVEFNQAVVLREYLLAK